MNNIIGNGMLAKSFQKAADLNTCFFCSGVSNSNETRRSEFDREKKLLINSLRKNDNRKKTYFSSVQVNNPQSHYFEHKKEMELVVKENSSDYLIVRLPQAVGVTTNTTIFPSFVKAIYLREEITIFKNATRSID